ncbi:DUF202 domain-containing protein [Streptomyces sp. NPDC088147]|uniref:DUF202 domain-containing protein n=1 Tax=Streptomyces sp. NPDC088147 TaxID=3365830 RepID=UPI00382F3BF3
MTAPAGGGDGDGAGRDGGRGADGDGARGGDGAGGGAPVRDPGLQPERTRLAWRRTTLSCTVVAVLAARQAIHGGATAAGLAGAALSALVWLAFLAVAHRRTLALAAAVPGPLPSRAAIAAAGCTILLALFAVGVLA